MTHISLVHPARLGCTRLLWNPRFAWVGPPGTPGSTLVAPKSTWRHRCPSSGAGQQPRPRHVVEGTTPVPRHHGGRSGRAEAAADLGAVPGLPGGHAAPLGPPARLSGTPWSPDSTLVAPASTWRHQCHSSGAGQQPRPHHVAEGTTPVPRHHGRRSGRAEAAADLGAVPGSPGGHTAPLGPPARLGGNPWTPGTTLVAPTST